MFVIERKLTWFVEIHHVRNDVDRNWEHDGAVILSSNTAQCL